MLPILSIIEALVVGILAGTVMIYAFQTKVSYPRWMMQSFEHPWLLLLILISAIVCFKWVPNVSVMVILIIVALWIDNMLFVKHPQWHNKQPIKVINDVHQQQNDSNMEVWPFESSTSNMRGSIQTYGPALAGISIKQPNFPTFFGTDIAQPGPAPFV